MKSKKILLAYYGLPRATSVCLPSVRKNIIEALRQEGIDVEETGLLIYQDSILNVRSDERGAINQENYTLLESVCSTININEELHRSYLESLKIYGDNWRDDFVSLSNMLRQFICLSALADKIRDVEYDQVVLCRVDLLCHRRLSGSELKTIIHGSDKIILPNWGNHKGVNDRFMICPKKYVDVVLRRIELASAYCEKYGPFQSEKFLSWVIESHQIPCDFISMPLSRVRVGGVIRRERFKPRNVSKLRKFLHTAVHRRLPSSFTYKLGWYY